MMQSFNNDTKVKAKYVARLKAHKLADEIQKGYYWENGKGCAVGCTIHSNRHDAYETELGLPKWLAYLEDEIFEGLANEEAKEFPLAFLKAIPIGITEDKFEELKHKLAILRLNRVLKIQKKQYKKTPKEYIKKVIEAIELTINYHNNPTEELRLTASKSAQSSASSAASAALAWSVEESAWSAAAVLSWSVEKSAWSAASAAAESVWSAASSEWLEAKSAALYTSSAWSSAKSAAWLAEESAWSASLSAAKSAAWSASSAAWSAEAKDLIKLLKELK